MFNYRHYALLTKLVDFLPDHIYLGLRHRITMGRWPSFSNPTNFNEHILSSLLSKEGSQLKSLICDKIGVRDHVKKLIGPSHLTKIHAVWDGTGPLPIEDLPDRFVVKPSHASGEVQVVWDKSKLDADELLATCRRWLAIDYGRATREYVYTNVPRQIMFEELLIDPKNGRVPDDYKFYVFDGVPRAIKVHIDRFGDYEITYFDGNWNHLPGRLNPPVDGPSMPAPENLQLMMELSAKLSEGLDFIRVDLYDLGDRVVFGELTSFPGGGNQHQTNQFDAYLGHFMNTKIDAATDVAFVP